MTARRWPLLTLLLGLGVAIAAPHPPQALTMQRQPREPQTWAQTQTPSPPQDPQPRPAAVPAEPPPQAQERQRQPVAAASPAARPVASKPQRKAQQARRSAAQHKRHLQARSQAAKQQQARLRAAHQRPLALHSPASRLASARPAAYNQPRRPASSVPGQAPAVTPRMSTAISTHRQWVLRTGDHEGRPFAVIDKRQARLWLFDAAGQPLGNTPVLLGLARGDASVPGIGERPMNLIQPHERTTPAGRFVAEPGRNTKGEDIFWVDYDAAVSLHRVRPTNPAERRLQRLASSTPADNRISYGCINVPAAFYDARIRPVFTQQRGVVYLLPETLPTASLFTPGPVQTAQRAR